MKRQWRSQKIWSWIRYTNLLTSCKLTAYLADIRAQVKGMLDRVEIVDVVEEEQTVRRGISGKYKRR